MKAICPVVQAVGQLVWAGSETKILRFDNFNPVSSKA